MGVCDTADLAAVRALSLSPFIVCVGVCLSLSLCLAFSPSPVFLLYLSLSIYLCDTADLAAVRPQTAAFSCALTPTRCCLGVS